MTRFPHVGRFHFLRDETFHHCWIHICHISSHWLIWVWWNPCRAFDVSTSSVSINAMSHPGNVLPSGEFFFYSVTVVGVDDGSIPSMRHFHHHRCLPPKVSPSEGVFLRRCRINTAERQRWLPLWLQFQSAGALRQSLITLLLSLMSLSQSQCPGAIISLRVGKVRIKTLSKVIW